MYGMVRKHRQVKPLDYMHYYCQGHWLSLMKTVHAKALF